MSEHIVEPELFEEALGLALDPSNDTQLGVNTIHDCVLDGMMGRSDVDMSVRG